MTFYIACSTSTCSENGVPKETADGFRDAFEAGAIRCGVCGEPVTDEAGAPRTEPA